MRLAHHLLAYVSMLDRDRSRFADCSRRVNVLPLGSAALAGAAFPIDRSFQLLFMGFDPTASASDVAKRRAYDKSVLDYVTGDINSLSVKLGKTDASKLDRYLTGVRALESQVMDGAAGNAGYLGTAYNPFGVEGGGDGKGNPKNGEMRVRGISLPNGFTLEELDKTRMRTIGMIRRMVVGGPGSKDFTETHAGVYGPSETQVNRLVRA